MFNLRMFLAFEFLKIQTRCRYKFYGERNYTETEMKDGANPRYNHERLMKFSKVDHKVTACANCARQGRTPHSSVLLLQLVLCCGIVSLQKIRAQILSGSFSSIPCLLKSFLFPVAYHTGGTSD